MPERVNLHLKAFTMFGSNLWHARIDEYSASPNLAPFPSLRPSEPALMNGSAVLHE